MWGVCGGIGDADVGVAAEPAGGGFVGGGTWPMTMQ